MHTKYDDFLQEARAFIPAERVYTDELRRLAWGTDAGFYRLIPQIIIRSENEQEVSRLKFKQTDRPVAVHVTCSMRLMGLANTIQSGQALLQDCSRARRSGLLRLCRRPWFHTPRSEQVCAAQAQATA